MQEKEGGKPLLKTHIKVIPCDIVSAESGQVNSQGKADLMLSLRIQCTSGVSWTGTGGGTSQWL